MRATGYRLIPLCCVLAACNPNAIQPHNKHPPLRRPARLRPRLGNRPQVANTTAVAPDSGRNGALPTLAPMLKRASPGVVNISVEGTVQVDQSGKEIRCSPIRSSSVFSICRPIQSR